MNKEEFKKELLDLGINLTQDQEEQLSTYALFLKEYNEHTNLTTITEEQDVYLKHFYDSLTIVKAIDLSKINNLLDIGTGAGFPGMVLKIVYPNLEVTLLDSNQKKLTFLQELSDKLGIKVNLVHDRAENYIKENRESFDLVTSRAVANLRVLEELAIPFVKVNHYFIAMKANASEELAISKDLLPKLDTTLEQVIEFKLPKEDSNRTLIVMKKNKVTKSLYPRAYDKIKKEAERNK